MRQLNIANLVAYVVAVIFAGLGLAIIMGVIELNIEATPRKIFGAVLILMGIYRFAITRMKASPSKQRRKIFDEDE